MSAMIENKILEVYRFIITGFYKLQENFVLSVLTLKANRSRVNSNSIEREPNSIIEILKKHYMTH